MPTFEYEALSPDGQRSNGTLDAGAIDLAAAALERRGLDVVRLARAPALPIKLPPVTKAIGPIPKTQRQAAGTQNRPASIHDYVPLPSSLVEQAFFFKRLEHFLRAGVPLVSAMETLGRQTQSRELQKAIERMRQNADSGEPLGDAFAAFPKTFTPLIVAVVRAGETGGFLPDALMHISEYIDDELEIRRLYRQLTLTPKLYTLAACAISLVFAQLMFVLFWLPILVVWLILKALRHNPGFRAFRDRNVLKIPVIGGISREFAEAKFARAFGLLFENGVNAATSVEYAANACGNQAFRDALYPAGERLRNGEPIHTALRQTGVLSDKFNDMLATGVQTGDVRPMLSRICEEYSAEAKHRSVQLAWYLSAAFFFWFCLVWAGLMLSGVSGTPTIPIPRDPDPRSPFH